MLTKYPVFSKEIVRMNSPHLSDGTEDKCAVSLTLGFIFSRSRLLFRYIYLFINSAITQQLLHGGVNLVKQQGAV